MSVLNKLLSINAIVALTMVFGLVNNIAITGVFGLNRSVDAYFASFVLVNLFIILVIDFLGKNFLPIFAVRSDESTESASRLTSIVVTKIGLLSVMVAAVLVGLSGYLFRLLLPGFESDAIEIVSATFMIMAPCIAIKSVNAFHEYVWQYHEHYNRVVISRVFVPITLTVFILALGNVIGTQALPYGFLVGHIFSFLFLIYRIPYRFQPRFDFADRDFIKIMRNSGVLMSTGFIARSKSVFVQYFASQLGEGAIAAVSIAQKICRPIYQSALVGIRMILFSMSAKAVARSDFAAFARMHNLAFTGVFFFTVPIAAWYAVEGDLIVRTVFQRGAFTDEMTSLVYAALLGYAVSIIFAGAVQISSNAFYAMDRVGVPATVMPLWPILFIPVAYFAVPAFGIVGLAGTTSVISAIIFSLMIWRMKVMVSALAVDSILISLLKYALIAALAVLAASQVSEMIVLNKYVRMAVSAGVVGAVYIALTWLLADKLLFAILDRLGVGDVAAINWPKRRRT